MANKVTATPAALELLAEIIAEHGPVLFHQSGGCCDGSSPMCYPRGEFFIGDHDVKLGEIGGAPSISTPHNTRRGSTRISSSMSCPVGAGCSPWRTEQSDDSSPGLKSASYSSAESRADHDRLVSQIVRPVYAARSMLRGSSAKLTQLLPMAPRHGLEVWSPP